MNSTDFSTADATLSTVEEGEVRVNLGEKSTGQGFGAACSLWGTDGFIGCPNAPDDSGAAQIVYLQDGNEKLGIASRDARYNDKVGALAEGDRAIVSGCAARLMLKKASSNISLITENQPDGNTTQVLTLDGSKGKTRIVCGGAQINMDKDSIVLMAGGTVVKIDSGGFTVLGKATTLATSCGALGTAGPAAGPVGARSILVGPIGLSGIPSAGWTVAV